MRRTRTTGRIKNGRIMIYRRGRFMEAVKTMEITKSREIWTSCTLKCWIIPNYRVSVGFLTLAHNVLRIGVVATTLI